MIGPTVWFFCLYRGGSWKSLVGFADVDFCYQILTCYPSFNFGFRLMRRTAHVTGLSCS